MSIPFQDSETAKNLLRAFAGESQARNRYDFAANLCQKQELQAMAFIFQATAKQEQAHAKVFWDHLQALNGQNLPIYGAYPIEGTNRILELLRAAQHNEHEEHGSVYPSFAAIATQEGFPEAAASFRQIAAIEQLHGEFRPAGRPAGKWGSVRLADRDRLDVSKLRPHPKQSGGPEAVPRL